MALVPSFWLKEPFEEIHERYGKCDFDFVKCNERAAALTAQQQQQQQQQQQLLHPSSIVESASSASTQRSSKSAPNSRAPSRRRPVVTTTGALHKPAAANDDKARKNRFSLNVPKQSTSKVQKIMNRVRHTSTANRAGQPVPELPPKLPHQRGNKIK